MNNKNKFNFNSEVHICLPSKITNAEKRTISAPGQEENIIHSIEFNSPIVICVTLAVAAGHHHHHPGSRSNGRGASGGQVHPFVSGHWHRGRGRTGGRAPERAAQTSTICHNGAHTGWRTALATTKTTTTTATPASQERRSGCRQIGKLAAHNAPFHPLEHGWEGKIRAHPETSNSRRPEDNTN